jgi:predicted acetyltransferase
MPFRLHARVPFWSASPRIFKFLDPGPLVDQELELVPPDAQFIDSILTIAKHPTTIANSPELVDISRQQLLDFLSVCPGGRQPGDASAGLSPCYHFWMRRNDLPDFPIAGAVSLRIGNSYDTVMYYGHIGYHVYPLYQRGDREKCRYRLDLAQ